MKNLYLLPDPFNLSPDPFNSFNKSSLSPLIIAFALILSIFLFPAPLFAASDNNCPGILKNTLSISDKTWSGDFQVRKNSDPNDYIYFDITDNGFINISAVKGSYNKEYNFSISKNSCGGHEIYGRSSGKNHTKNNISVSDGDKIYIRMDAEGYGNNDKRNLHLSINFTSSSDLSISKSVDEAAPNIGDRIKFTIIGTNNGTGKSKIKIVDTLPAGLTYKSRTEDSSDFACGKSGSKITCQGNRLFSQGESVTITIDAEVTQSGSITNTATIESKSGVSDPNSNNNSADSIITVPVPSADLSITKIVDDSTPNIGDVVVFTIVGTNNGSSDSEFTITDTLPAGLTFDTTYNSDGVSENRGSFSCSTSGQTATCEGGHNFTTGDTVTVTIHAKVTQSGTITNSASIVSRDGVLDSDSGNNSASVDIIIANQPPTANPQSITVDENSTNNAITLTGDDPDGDNSALAYTVVTAPSHGTLSCSDCNNPTYTPTAGYHGADSFTFKVNDGTDDSSAATVSITVTEPLIIVENADDLCYNKIDPSGMMCMDMGICSGGIGCKNSIPLENIGDGELSSISVLYDESGGMGGSFGGNCGVDPSGTCQTTSGIDMGPVGMMGQVTEFNLTNPMPIGDDTQSVWAKEFMSGQCFGQEKIYGSYMKDGVLYRGQIKSCDAVPPPPDEPVPNEDNNPTEPICDTFADMFQTHGTCSGSSGGTINFNNAGSLLDGSTNIILGNDDNSLNTCQVTTPSWVSTDFETCGTEGDCVETGKSANALTVNYNNPPAAANVNANPSSSTDDLTLSANSTLSGYEYDDITTSYHTNINTIFDITNQLKINTLKMTTDNTFNFQSSNPYALDIGTLGVENNGVNNTISTDANAKNIKINTFELPSGTTLSLEASQTIKMNSFTVGRGSNITLKAQYLNINNFTSSNSGSGDSVINLYADYIDISTLTLEQTVTLNIYPFTTGKRILFRVNTLTESSSSSILMSSGNYYINTTLSIPGTSDVSALRATDANAIINLYLNSDLTLGNNPGINAEGNNGNYTTAFPAANFIFFINGDFTTGGGGTTVNATIYTEGDATLGNPTYIKGALSAHELIDVGQGQFTYDQSLDDDSWGECGIYVEFSQATYNFDEPAIDGTLPSKTYQDVTIVLSKAADVDVNVTYVTYDDSPLGTFSAEESVDYQPNIPNPQFVTFTAGETSKTVHTTILQDDLIELDETFNAELLDPLPNPYLQLGTINKAQLIINGQDETDVPLCFADDFNSTLDTKWRTLFSSGGFEPQIVDKRLRLTNRLGNLATAVTKDYEFLAEHNMIIVEFEQYAYGGCESGQSATKGGGLGTYGADGIVMTLFSSISPTTGHKLDSPEPGAYGGSMGYAQGHGKKGFEGAWLGLGIDEYGNFINPTEGRDGGLGFYPNNVTIRGSSDDLNGGDRYSGYRYLDSNKNLPHHVASKNRSPAYPGDKYRLRIDARNPASLFVSLAQDSGTGYQTIIPTFDAKAVGNNQAPSPEYVRLAFTSGSGGGCNNHEIDELSVHGVCRPYRPAGTKAFRVTELNSTHTNWKEKWENNDLTTRIAPLNNKPYCVVASNDGENYYPELLDINVTALTENGNTVTTIATNAEINTTVPWYCFNYTNSNAEQNVTFLITDNNHPDQFSYSDAFAIRPATFNITFPGEDISRLPAGSLPMEVNATSPSPSTIGIQGYSLHFPDPVVSDRNASYRIDLSTANDPSCSVNDSAAIDTTFINGTSTPTFTYNNVGDINISYLDNNWTYVDQINSDCILNDDRTNGTGVMPTSKVSKSLNGCSITGSQLVTFIPFELNITNVTVNNASGPNGFTYLSNNAAQMGSEINVTIRAESSSDQVLTNYSDLCYAKDANLSIYHTGDPHNNDAPNFIVAYDAGNDRNFTNQTPISPNRFDFNRSNFTSGIANISLKQNFDRNITQPIEPFVFTVNDINFTDTTNTTGGITVNKALNYVYGRLHTPRYRINGRDGNITHYYEVYCSTCNPSSGNFGGTIGMGSVDSVNWYRNPDHNSSTLGTLRTVSTPRRSTSITTTSGTFLRESVRYTGSQYPYKVTMDVNASPWLIYNRFDATVDVNPFDIEFNQKGTVDDNAPNMTNDTAEVNSNRRIMW